MFLSYKSIENSQKYWFSSGLIASLAQLSPQSFHLNPSPSLLFNPYTKIHCTTFADKLTQPNNLPCIAGFHDPKHQLDGVNVILCRCARRFALCHRFIKLMQKIVLFVTFHMN